VDYIAKKEAMVGKYIIISLNMSSTTWTLESNFVHALITASKSPSEVPNNAHMISLLRDLCRFEIFGPR
jgi:hypothetical protein